ncbi:MAG TPA: DUF4124 domain-containing protein [Burkholderiaceae bacterium]|nr:DUF4124 domain-containing protein [Burkholderiaceae bacterium]
MKFKFLFSLITLASVLPAVAQYQWIDANGRKVFSDQPPPASVPAKKVMQQPRNTTIPANLDKANPADTATPTDAKTENENTRTSPPAKKDNNAGKDKELEAKKKAAEEAEAAKKKAEAEKQAAVQRDNCDRAKRAKMTLDSGVRTTVTNSKGEREFMDEAARMVETKRIEGIIAADCKAVP